MKNNLNCVYKIENSLTEDIYIGSTKYLARRKGEHLYKLRNRVHSNKQLQVLFDKDPSCLSFIVLEKDIINLKEKEQYYLDVYTPSLNVCKKADSSLGYKHSEECKKAMSEARKGKQNSLGRINTPETKEKMRQSALRRFELERIRNNA